MRVGQLVLHQFRSHELVSLDLDPGVTVFVGANGQGKTNLVEAVDYLATLASHRVAHDAPLVRHGAEAATIQAVVTRDDRSVTLEVQINPGKANRGAVNRNPVPRMRDLLGWVRTVVFSPEDLALVKGDPSGRRRFLDQVLVQRQPALAGTIQDYERTLKQRNSLLKTLGAARRAGTTEEALSTLHVWDEHLVRHGATLTAARLALVGELRPHLEQAYASLARDSARGQAGMRYEPHLRGEPAEYASADPADIEARLAEEVRTRQRDEIDRGVTLVGPHRDELALTLGDGETELPVRGYASHGESWTFALALKVAAYALLRADGDDPVLILDDVFAELDSARRAALVDVVGDAEQLLITAAVAEDVPVELSGARFRVDRGTVTRER